MAVCFEKLVKSDGKTSKTKLHISTVAFFLFVFFIKVPPDYLIHKCLFPLFLIVVTHETFNSDDSPVLGTYTHTHNDTHEGLSLKLFGTKVAFKKQKRQREKCPQESLREVKMKKAEMHLFQSLCLEVIRWQNCSENLAACPSTEIKYKDTAPSFKVVLLQNLKMQFVRLAKLSEESINTASKNLPKTKHKETSAAEIFLSPRRRAGSSSQLTNCIFNL